jgi:hypothetical protein
MTTPKDFSQYTLFYILLSNTMLLFEPLVFRCIWYYNAYQCFELRIIIAGIWMLMFVISLMACGFVLIPRKVSYKVLMCFFIMIITNYIVHAFMSILGMIFLRSKLDVTCLNKTIDDRLIEFVSVPIYVWLVLFTLVNSTCFYYLDELLIYRNKQSIESDVLDKRS